MTELIQLLEVKFGLYCRACGGKVLDPDKKTNQKFFEGKCPSCGQMSCEERKTKRQLKRERRAARKLHAIFSSSDNIRTVS